MSNVKTGDLAILLTAKESIKPICQVGPRAEGPCIVKLTNGKVLKKVPKASILHWWCQFRAPVYWGNNLVTGELGYCDYFPVADMYLRRISDGDLQGILSGADPDLFLPVPLNAEERAAIKEATEKKGTVKP